MVDFILLIIGILQSIFGFILIRKYYYQIRDLTWYDTLFLTSLSLFLLSFIIFGMGVAVALNKLLKVL
ncbi:hypothetical protein D7004_17665 [Pedobacter jejuensis]|uniref:Uncharacterized protein n=1 Tax=Pedobacter jejuensis TaxID=1268550 RepID=A0A3N0BPA2_9SPHI|nr:hypothetical protein D7004_17665 [Pedobacter jejuensis]